jgi:hypothetical protein
MGKVQSTVEQLQKLVPKLAKEKRHISKILYQKLALGSSVSIEAIAIELHKSPQQWDTHSIHCAQDRDSGISQFLPLRPDGLVY